MVLPEYLLPSVIHTAGEQASRRFLEFFAANIRNLNTRQAHARAVGEFFAWCDMRVLALEQIEPMVVASYVELHKASAPTVKQHLPALRRLLDWLVVGQVLRSNPASWSVDRSGKLTPRPLHPGNALMMVKARARAAGRAGIDVLPHLPRHAYHGVSEQRRVAGKRAVHRRARLGIDHETLRPARRQDRPERD
jgi:hypothetical protein